VENPVNSTLKRALYLSFRQKAGLLSSSPQNKSINGLISSVSCNLFLIHRYKMNIERIHKSMEKTRFVVVGSLVLAIVTALLSFGKSPHGQLHLNQKQAKESAEFRNIGNTGGGYAHDGTNAAEHWVPSGLT
jgi:hypothetical protein